MVDVEVLVVGAGEVGLPLAEVLSGSFQVVTKDVEPLALEGVEVMHVCYPFDADTFVETTVGYAEMYKPRLLIVNSTVVPGTTQRIADATGLAVAYSPVRGKHTRMAEELTKYSKFVASRESATVEKAAEHFRKAGIPVQTVNSTEGLELAKLVETSYFGVLLGWAQEVERMSRAVGADYFEVQRFVEEVDFLPRVVFDPGFIGGHCVIPNSHLLDEVAPSLFMAAMRSSNELKAEEWRAAGRSLAERVFPRALEGAWSSPNTPTS